MACMSDIQLCIKRRNKQPYVANTFLILSIGKIVILQFFGIWIKIRSHNWHSHLDQIPESFLISNVTIGYIKSFCLLVSIYILYWITSRILLKDKLEMMFHFKEKKNYYKGNIE